MRNVRWGFGILKKEVDDSDLSLVLPEFSQAVVLKTDASGGGISAVFSQEQDGHIHPCCLRQ